MPRPTTKNDLMTAAKENYEKLNLLISKMTEEELNTPFDFSKDEKNQRIYQTKHSRRNRTGSFRTDRPRVQRNGHPDRNRRIYLGAYRRSRKLQPSSTVDSGGIRSG